MAKALRHLGRPSRPPASPAAALLDRVANPHANTNYVARFTVPEFTCVCPITGQPDFAHLVIDYVPGRYLVESKSLKLYLNSFRNHGAFHDRRQATAHGLDFGQFGHASSGRFAGRRR